MSIAVWHNTDELSAKKLLGGSQLMSLQLARALSTFAETKLVHVNYSSEKIFGGFKDIPIHPQRGSLFSHEFDYVRKSMEFLRGDVRAVYLNDHLSHVFLKKQPERAILFLNSGPLSRAAQGGNGFYPNVFRKWYWNRALVAKAFMALKRKRLRVDAVLSCSNSLGAEAEKAFPQFEHRVIYNPVDLKGIGSRMEEKKGFVLFAGALIPEKGVLALLKAAEILRGNGFKEKFLFVGSPEMWGRQADFTGLIAKGREIGGVEFLGLKEHSCVLGLMRQATVGVVPSEVGEAFSLTAAEFQACFTPVVASKIGGLPEVVSDGEGGFLAEPGNPCDLAEKIAFLLENPSEAKKMGEKGRKNVEKRFSMEKFTAEHRELLKGLGVL